MNPTLLATGVATGAVTQIQTGPTALTAPAGAISIAPGDDIQALVDAAQPGDVFFLEAGTHRMQSVVPQDGQQFYGQEGAIMSGARLLTGFENEGGSWVIGGQTQEGERRALDEATDGFDRGGYPETVFIDDVPLRPVAALADLAPGTFYFDYAADEIHIADDPSGHMVEAGATAYAFHGNATNVVVQNLVVEKYSSPVQHGAIGGAVGPEGWVVQNNEIRLNFGVGATVGTNGRLVGNDVHDNGQMGLGGNGDNIVVEGNEIARNGFFSGIDPLWEGGGTKFAETDNLVVRNNYSHDNNGYGLWTDIDNINTLYEGNRVEYNSQGGINHEISYDAVIRGNSLVGNGSAAPDGWLWGSAIQLQNSSNVEVYDNAIDMTGAGNAVGLIQQDRGGGAFGEYVTTGNSVHDNAIYSSSAASGEFGAVADANEAQLLGGGNTFDSNNYFVVDTAAERWNWGDDYTWDGYRAASGQDTNSTLTLVPEASQPPRDVEPDLPPSVEPSTPIGPDVPTVPVEPVSGSNTPAPVPVNPDPVDPAPLPSAPEPEPGVPTIPADPVSAPDPLAPLPVDPDPVDPTPVPSPVPAPEPAVLGRDIVGTRRGDDLSGTDGADTIEGRSGHDVLAGLAGNDVIEGGRGRDHIEGGAGDDVLSGGRGHDMFVFLEGFGNDTIEDFRSGGCSSDTLLFSSEIFESKEDVLAAAQQTEAGTRIDVGDHSILLRDVELRHLDLGDFMLT